MKKFGVVREGIIEGEKRGDGEEEGDDDVRKQGNGGWSEVKEAV